MGFDYMTKIEGVPSKKAARAGMAYFSGTGPYDAACGKCAFYGGKASGTEKKCTTYRDMAHDWGPNLPKRQPACKYFQAKPPTPAQ
jgi:hypothetical protein